LAGVLVLGVDVGSVNRKGGFAWASSDAQLSGEDDPSALGRVIVDALNRGDQVALAFESPLSVPVPVAEGAGWKDLGRARAGEGNRPWSAGAGSGALATGLVQLAWVCRFVAEHCQPKPSVTTQIERFASGSRELLLSEAMVTADGKPEPVDGLQDQADALAAAKRLHEILSVGRSEGAVADVSCTPHRALNLAAVCALHAGLSIDADELHLDVVVAKVKPVP